jgi:TPR repeat protein
LIFSLALPVLAWTQSTPPVPNEYKRFFYLETDRRSLFEKALNSIGLTSLKVGRSYALIAGVSHYPNLGIVDQYLAPADVDIQKLEQYLKQQEYFDEIVVLKDGDMTLENLNYFLENYFPERLKHSPNSRFLFAYSGHGYADGTGETARGFVLKSSAANLQDATNAVDLKLLRTLIDSEVDAADKTLVLINACYSGAFIERKPFGGPLALEGKGAHAIVASTFSQRSWGDGSADVGSVFFEKVFDALSGLADRFPEDGVVTYHELDTYLRAEVPLATHGAQTPIEGDISRSGSEGEFFFLNRGRQLRAGNAPPWDPKVVTAFGIEGSVAIETDYRALDQGKEAFRGQNFPEAVELFLQAANKANSEAMFYLGYLYDQGQGVAQDYERARDWYQKAVAAGNVEAMNNLGALYADGHGVAKDYQQARLWYEKAAAAGIPMAMNNLGELYEHGHGVAQDYSQARQLYEKAAAAGIATAMFSLGYLYQQGDGVAQGYLEAWQWYEKAAAAGDVSAMNNLGALYADGHGVAKDYQQARLWYEKAAAAGSADAMNNLGFLYDQGQGAAKDYHQARLWYEKAAAVGNTAAMYNLGFLYRNGHGAAKNPQLERQWFEKAAAAGSAMAMYNLGMLYRYGQGVAKDYLQARQWFEKAAAADDADAMYNLGDLYEHGHGVAKDYQQARQWFEKAATAGSADAMYNLGYIYEHGHGVAKNYELARQWYEKARAAGNHNAKWRLRRLPK